MAPECFACPEGDRLRWTDRLDIICLGRCSCTNQVSSVSLSVLCRQRMDISPVTQKKKMLTPMVDLLLLKATFVAPVERHERAPFLGAKKKTDASPSGIKLKENVHQQQSQWLPSVALA